MILKYNNKKKCLAYPSDVAYKPLKDKVKENLNDNSDC